MARPLLITDCDEVLLHMVVPFAQWLDEAHDVDFDLHNSDWSKALTYKSTGALMEGEKIFTLLRGFFLTEMHRQQPIIGAVDAISALANGADVVVLTNLHDEERDARAAQLRAIGIDVPVYTNQGGKGGVMARILNEYAPSVAVFVDDLAHQHSSIAEHTPHVWRLHMVGEPIIAPRIKPADDAHHRIDDWATATQWIRDCFEKESADAA
jgi:hypothetical protein